MTPVTPLTATTRKAAPMDTPKTPAKRWRVIAGDVTTDCTSEKKAYDHINNLAAIGTAALGLRITVWRWERGHWGLYERAVITENGWEPA